MTLDIHQFASELFEAEKKTKGIQPLTERNASLTVEDAYHIQLKIMEMKLEEGKKVIGKKVGLTSDVMQKMLQVNEPDYGHLFDDMRVASGRTVDVCTMVAPK